MYLAVKPFRYAVEGRDFVIYTDHKPLTYAFHQTLEKCSPRQNRYLDFIVQFTADIRYVKGVENEVADTPSRIETAENSVDRRTLATAQQCDKELH